MNENISNEDLVIAIQNGNKKDIEVLWKNVHRLISLHAYRYYQRFRDNSIATEEDLIQEGYMALLEAIKYFDINSGYKFTTYLNYTLKNAFQRVMGLKTSKQRNEPLNNCFSLNSNISQDDEETEEIDFIIDETALKQFERIEVSETQQIVWEAISHLDERSREVIIMKYFKDMTLRNISNVLSVTVETVRQIELKALRTLRKMPSLRSLYFEMEELETQQRLNYVEYNPECFELIRKIERNAIL
ncbi:MAG: sigma-70 family RNA polymerase sigma factor [Anaeroplasma sp.]